MVVAEALDFPGAVTQGFDLPDARLMIASALENIAQSLLEEGKPLPVPATDASAPDADLIELIAVSIQAGTASTSCWTISAAMGANWRVKALDTRSTSILQMGPRFQCHAIPR